MKKIRTDFSFYFIWGIIFTIINVGIIFLLEYFDFIPLIKSKLSPKSLQEQSIQKEQTTDMLNNTKNYQNSEPISEYAPIQKQDTQYVAKTNVSHSQTSYNYTLPPYFEDVILEENAQFISDDGNVFQIGYITISAIFPYQFNTIPTNQIPIDFQNGNNTALVSFRVLLGWDNLETFSKLSQQQEQQQSSSLTLQIPSLTVLQLQGSNIANINNKTQANIQFLIQKEIEQQLQQNNIPKKIKSAALRILGSNYTMRGFQNITMSFSK